MSVRMQPDFPVNYVVRQAEENGDVSIWPFQYWKEAHDWLTWLRKQEIFANDHIELLSLPIPLSHLLYFSGLREAGGAIRSGARVISP